MPKLRTVEAYPMTRHPEHPWHSDEDLAAFLAASRGVFDLYSDELPAAEQSARASAIRLFLEDAKSSAGFGVTVFDRFDQSFDFARVAIPEGFSGLDAAERAHAALDVIHGTVVGALAPLRGWDSDRLNEVRRRVEGRGLRFTWVSDWKTSPGRRHQARGLYWLDREEGHGHVQLEIRRYGDQTVIARSEPVLAFMTAEGFKRSAATLHWHNADVVSAAPWAGLLGDYVGILQLTATDALTSLALPQEITANGPVTEVTTTVLTGEEWRDDPDLPWLYLEVIVPLRSGAYGPEFERASGLLARDADFAAWWDQTPYRRLILRISLREPRWPKDSPKAGARKNGKDLVLQIVTPRADLPPKTDSAALRERARADLHGALVDVAAARKFPPPPPMPARIRMNAREWRAQADR